MITLAIDTSTPHGSVALLADGALLFDERFTADRSHSSSLFVALEKARALADKVDQIAIGLGPGSYAGVRIAIAAALGLRFALGAKLVGIPSVAALEVTAPAYIAIGDARRESFYFSRIEQGVCAEGPLLATEAELQHRLAASGALPIYATAATAAVPRRPNRPALRPPPRAPRRSGPQHRRHRPSRAHLPARAAHHPAKAAPGSPPFFVSWTGRLNGRINGASSLLSRFRLQGEVGASL